MHAARPPELRQRKGRHGASDVGFSFDATKPRAWLGPLPMRSATRSRAAAPTSGTGWPAGR
eukprot:1542341-Pyramimonas_sp.AAC.1